MNDSLFRLKPLIAVGMLAVFWIWETVQPFMGQRDNGNRAGRWRHAARNLTVAAASAGVLAVAFGAATVGVVEWTERHRIGLLHAIDLGDTATFLMGLGLLDAWLYVWHRANHKVPFLWRFHRMHHSDDQMDVTTATRFHLGELVLSASLRLLLIPLLGLSVWQLVVYDMLQLAGSQFQHADISLGRCDRWLRWLIVTPDMHKLHHSRVSSELNSNYAVVLSVWDRLARTFRLRSDAREIVFGLEDFEEPKWQTIGGMLRTPLAKFDRRPEI